MKEQEKIGIMEQHERDMERIQELCMMDANITEPGDKYEKLAETYVIFITENDIPGKGKPLYHIDRYYEETGELFMDGAHIIYVNSQIKDDTELGRLMQDFYCKVPEEMHYKELAKAAGYLKRSEKGVQSMGGVLDEMCEEVATAAREFGRQEGRDQTLIALICRKLKKRKDVATIAEELEEDIETVENICKVAEKFAPEYDVEQIYEELHTVAV